MSKKLFIQTINSMVDMETIFIAHPSYWSDVYDRLQAGRTDGIDQTFITVFKTIQAVQQIQNNSALIRADQEVKASRMLTSAIEYRMQKKGLEITEKQCAYDLGVIIRTKGTGVISFKPTGMRTMWIYDEKNAQEANQ